MPTAATPRPTPQRPSVWNAERAAEIIAAHTSQERGSQDGAALPMLHALQATFGYIPDDVLPMVADALNVTRAEVHGVVTFYHDFRRTPPGRHVLKLCRAEACQAVGGEALADHVRARLGVDWHETTRDGAVTLLPVYCLGLCACGPSALWDERPKGRLDADAVDALVTGARP